MQNTSINNDARMTSLCASLADNYRIAPEEFQNWNVKRGLRNADGTGVLAGITKVGSVKGYVVNDGAVEPVPGRLIYRGVDIMDIVDRHAANHTFGFEETAYLLLFGNTPDASQLETFRELLSVARRLPDGFTEDMIIKAPSPNIMNKLARATLALYSYDDDPDNMCAQSIARQSMELIARFPLIAANAFSVKRHYYDGESMHIHVPRPELSTAENFLHMLRPDNHYTAEEALLLDLMLILHAEHGGGNNSTFTARVLSSSGTDTYSAIAGAVCSLKGPLHGGANAKVMTMLADIEANVSNPLDEGQLTDYLRKIARKEAGDRSGKIYGMGHAVYTMSDPRSEVIKKFAGGLAVSKGYGDKLRLAEMVERLAPAILAESHKIGRICSNVDLFSGIVYEMLGIPEELYTPLFAVARITGWCAHRMEEVLTGGRIIRPAYRYV